MIPQDSFVLETTPTIFQLVNSDGKLISFSVRNGKGQWSIVSVLPKEVSGQ